MKKLFNAFILLVLISNNVLSQDKFWITFKDKDIENYSYQQFLSAQTISNRIKFNLPLYQYSDIPVKKEYIDVLKQQGIEIVSKSRWFNSVSASLSPEEVEQVKKLPFVSSLESIDRHIVSASSTTKLNPEIYHSAMTQMQAKELLASNLTGEGVVIGVIDAGFFGASDNRNLTHIFDERKILGQRDFLDPKRKDLIREPATESDTHGTTVLEMISGYATEEKYQSGLAVNARFYLARTENGAREYRGEEDKWVEAMEWMDSLGVRLINTSLGYATNMDDPKDNYKQEEMNGKTTRISKAAQIASDEKGIFLVVSAGNEGTSSWRIISSPADAEGALSVGATREKHWDKINYSSIGPDFLPYMKPNVSCYSPSGTSFSAPAITGFVACLMQKDPSMSNKQLKAVVEKSGHLYPYGNNYIGFGVPQASKAIQLMDSKNASIVGEEKKVGGKKVKLKFPKGTNIEGVAFHKKNETIVVTQEIIQIKGRKSKSGKREKPAILKLRRRPGVVRTTLSFGPQVIEIFWDK